MTNTPKPIKIRVHIISPVNIGCDDVYEPTSFVINEQTKKLIEFDPLDFIEKLSAKEREEFNRIISTDNILAIYKAIKRFYKPGLIGKEVEVTPGLVEHYKKILEMGTYDKNEINNFTIYKTSYNPLTKKPYIPGSSLKGAIRTAFLSNLAVQKNIIKFNGKADELESTLLNRREGRDKIPSDPFRMLKISDLSTVSDAETKIIYAINRKKTVSSTSPNRAGVYQILEVLKPGAVFEGTIKIDKPMGPINLEINPDELFKSVHDFYKEILKQEITPLHESLNIKHEAGIQVNKKFKEKLGKTAFIAKIGRHSGAEAVTIKNNRKIAIRQGRGRIIFDEQATTFWLASDKRKPETNNGLIPFGWAIIEKVE